MSIKVMSQVWQHSRQSGGPLLVELAIADYADDNGCAFPSVVSLAKKARLTERQTWKVIADLKKAGTLKVEVGGGRGRSNRYRLIFGNPEVENTELRNSEINSVNSTALNPAIRSTKTLSPMTGDPSSDPSLIRQYKKPRSQARSKPDFEIWFFSEFKPTYPTNRRNNQVGWAMERVRKIKPDATYRVQLIERLQKWKACDEWMKEGGKYVPGIGNFFRNGLYECDPPPLTSNGKSVSLPPTADDYYRGAQ